MAELSMDEGCRCTVQWGVTVQNGRGAVSALSSAWQTAQIT